MLVGYMRVSSDSDRQTTALQRDALLAAGVDERHLFEDKASGARDHRPGLARALDFMRPGVMLESEFLLRCYSDPCYVPRNTTRASTAFTP